MASARPPAYGMGKQVRAVSVGKQVARSVGGGKQISRPVGGGKQLSQRRFYGGKRPRGADDDEDEDDEDEAEEGEEGGAKEEEEEDEDEFGQWDEDEEEEEEPAEEEVAAPTPVGKVGKAMAVGVGMGKQAKRPVGVGMGKQARPVGIGMGKQARPVGVGMGKQARPVGVGMGKQARPVGVGVGKAVGIGKGKQASVRAVMGGKQVTQRQFYGGKRPRGKAASDDEESEEEDSEEEEEGGKGGAGGDEAGASAGEDAGAAGAEEREEEEEGEVAAPSGGRRRVVRKESESEEEEEDEEELDYNSADEYDADLYKGPEDRALLAAMNEMDREMILAERGEKRDNRREDLLVREKLKEQRERNAAAKRSSSRAKSGLSEKAAQMRDLATKRQAQSQRKEQERDRIRAAAAQDGAAPSSDDDAGAPSLLDPTARRRAADAPTAPEDDFDRPSGSSSAPAKEFQLPARVEELERLRLTRQKLEKWLLEPFFDKVVPGCYVRIGIGQQGSRPLYRVAEIVGVKDGFRPYMMGRAKTGKRLLLRIGASTKPFAMNFVSNQNFEQGELEKFQRACKDASVPLPSAPAIAAKVDELKRYKEHVYTEEEINQIVQLKKKAGVARGNLASEYSRIKHDIAAAQERGEVDKRIELEMQAKVMADRLAAEKEAQEKREATAFRIKDINTRNREFELRVSAAAGAKAQAERTGDAPSTKDPFARIENRGTNYYTIGAAKAAPIPKGAAAPAKTPEGGAGLSVAVPPPAAGVADAVSPGFRDLLATPRTPGGGLAASAHLDDAAAAAAEAAAAAFGGDVAGSTGAAGAGEGGGEEPSGRVGKPPLVGQKVGAHLAIELNIDLNAGAHTPGPRTPALFRTLAAARHATADAPRRAGTLSVSDYKARMGII